MKIEIKRYIFINYIDKVIIIKIKYNWLNYLKNKQMKCIIAQLHNYNFLYKYGIFKNTNTKHWKKNNAEKFREVIFLKQFSFYKYLKSIFFLFAVELNCQRAKPFHAIQGKGILNPVLSCVMKKYISKIIEWNCFQL